MGRTIITWLLLIMGALKFWEQNFNPHCIVFVVLLVLMSAQFTAISADMLITLSTQADWSCIDTAAGWL